MKKTVLAAIVGLATMGATYTASADLFMEYYRDNLFLGLAYHRVGCLTDWETIQSNQDYDGFSTTRYCFQGSSAASVPGASWFDWDVADSKAEADNCGAVANNRYGTEDYARRSETCSYNILFDCNSDCWIREFSSCMGKRVSIASPCW